MSPEIVFDTLQHYSCVPWGKTFRISGIQRGTLIASRYLIGAKIRGQLKWGLRDTFARDFNDTHVVGWTKVGISAHAWLTTKASWLQLVGIACPDRLNYARSVTDKFEGAQPNVGWIPKDVNDVYLRELFEINEFG